ncbi:pyridoxal kinase-like [Zophobas morio]|uniref:pyridoxal kinase-like n=1 Tax=Zophobas morio TaxID=2755281 RepID=UPI003082A541
MSYKRILSIQSYVVYGYVGNKCATFPLQLLGYEVDAINSVQFSNHTGYNYYSGSTLDGKQCKDLFTGLKNNGLLCHSHILTGYMASESILKSVTYIIMALKTKNSAIVYVCDPVLGDNDRLYVSETLVHLYRSELLPLADIITPNQFEAEILSGVKIVDDRSAKCAMEDLLRRGPLTVVITSCIFPDDDKHLHIFCMNRNNFYFKQTVRKVEVSGTYTGTGDLFSALFLAWIDKENYNFEVACKKALATLQHIILDTKRYIEENKFSASNEAALRELRLIQNKEVIENPPVKLLERS